MSRNSWRDLALHLNFKQHANKFSETPTALLTAVILYRPQKYFTRHDELLGGLILCTIPIPTFPI